MPAFQNRTDLFYLRLNRLIRPIPKLVTEAHVKEFMDVDKLWPGEFRTSFFRKNKAFLPNEIMPDYHHLRYKTRVMLLVLNRMEYKPEVK